MSRFILWGNLRHIKCSKVRVWVEKVLFFSPFLFSDYFWDFLGFLPIVCTVGWERVEWVVTLGFGLAGLAIAAFFESSFIGIIIVIFDHSFPVLHQPTLLLFLSNWYCFIVLLVQIGAWLVIKLRCNAHLCISSQHLATAWAIVCSVHITYLIITLLNQLWRILTLRITQQWDPIGLHRMLLVFSRTLLYWWLLWQSDFFLRMPIITKTDEFLLSLLNFLSQNLLSTLLADFSVIFQDFWRRFRYGSQRMEAFLSRLLVQGAAKRAHDIATIAQDII